MATNLHRVATRGYSGADLLGAGLGVRSVRVVRDDLHRASVLDDAVHVLKRRIEEEDWPPWEWAYSTSGEGCSRVEYEAALDALVEEVDRLHSGANREMMLYRALVRSRKREILELCEQRSKDLGLRHDPRILP